MQQATASHENSAAINAMPWPSMRTTYGRLLRNDLTITELWQKITAHGIKAGRSAVARFLLHLQLTKKTLHAAEQEPPDVKDAGAAWREMQKSLDPQRLVVRGVPFGCRAGADIRSRQDLVADKVAQDFRNADFADFLVSHHVQAIMWPDSRTILHDLIDETLHQHVAKAIGGRRPARSRRP